MSAEPTLLDFPQWKDRWQLTEVSIGSPVDLGSRAFASRTPMWEFRGADNVNVVSRVAVNVMVSMEGPNEELDEPIYVLACDRLHVFAAARNYWEAERSFQEQVTHYYLHYSNARAEDLDEESQSIQRLYRQHFYQKNAER